MMKKTKKFKYSTTQQEWILPWMLIIMHSDSGTIGEKWPKIQKIHTDLKGHRIPFELNSSKDGLVDKRPKRWR